MLQRDLERKTEYVLKLRPSEVQAALYTTYLKGLEDFGIEKALFTDYEVGFLGTEVSDGSDEDREGTGLYLRTGMVGCTCRLVRVRLHCTLHSLRD